MNRETFGDRAEDVVGRILVPGVTLP